MKKLLSIRETIDYLGISERSVRRIVNEHKVKSFKIGNKYFISKTSLDELYDPRPFNPQYITLHVKDTDVQVIVNTGWLPLDDYLHVHDILFLTKEHARVYDDLILEEVFRDLKKMFLGDYEGLYIKYWRYHCNEDLYYKLGFSYSGIEDWYICNWSKERSYI